MNSGIILVNKPKGISSNTVVNIVKRAVGAKKAGHLGTLDLQGEGLLPVTINKATKLFDMFLNKDKVYISTFQFGVLSSTLDLEGEIIARDNKKISAEDVENVIPSLVGRYSQMPPAYSAKKVNGKRAYDLARKGEEFSLKPKEIEIYSLKLLGQKGDNTFEFEIACSSGTYIRSLARDMGEKLSTYGIMQCILRTRCGIFDIKDAFTLEEIKQNKFSLISPEVLFDCNKISLSKEELDKLQSGVNITLNARDGEYKAYLGEQFVGIIKIQDNRAKFVYNFI